MARWLQLGAAALALTSIHALATEIRHVEVQSQPLLKGDPAEAAKRSQLKRGGNATPSPILVDQVATIAPDGSLQMGCGNRPVRDFRTLKPGTGDAQ